MPLETTLARLSAAEMVEALGWRRVPSILRLGATAAFSVLSMPLGRVLARFDRQIAERGIAEAAQAVLNELGVQVTVEGTVPASGALLVVANHPGAYDAFVLLAALGRRDAGILATDRTFLRALPHLAEHLVFVPEGSVAARAAGTRAALRHLDRKGALVHFAAGRIEPDPAFVERVSRGSPASNHGAAGADSLLRPWPDGTGILARAAARADGAVLAAIVRGVHSERAKALWVTRLAERRDVTTLAPLLQVAFPAYRHVKAHVSFSDARPARDLASDSHDGVTTERIRSMALELLALRQRG